MSNQLTPIPQESLVPLRNLYSKDWPKNIVPSYLLQNYINWYKKDPNYVKSNVEILCLNNDWSDGTFCVIVSNYSLLIIIKCLYQINLS